jgi:hypothetical protein
MLIISLYFRDSDGHCPNDIALTEETLFTGSKNFTVKEIEVFEIIKSTDFSRKSYSRR